MALLLKTSQVQKVQVYNARGNYESHGSYSWYGTTYGCTVLFG